jgi:hypothetical protein
MKLSDVPIKVGIAVPCRDQLHSMFAYSLANMIQYNSYNKIKSQLYMLSGSLIADQRHKLAYQCQIDDCSHILWLDSDMMFPQNTTEKLLQHNKAIVACNYSTRSEPRKSVAYYKVGEWDNWLNSKTAPETLTEISAIGMGCMLVDIKVFSKMDDPYFEVSYNRELQEWIGEDFYFCQKAAALGYKILVDNKLSMEISHLGTTAFTLNSL